MALIKEFWNVRSLSKFAQTWFDLTHYLILTNLIKWIFSSRRQDNGDGEDRQEEAGIGYIIHQSLQQQQQQQPAGHGWRRVEALRFEEEPVLVQPDEVKISLTQVVDRHSSDTTTPLSPIGRCNLISFNLI